jgi:hypothetical protein
VLLTRSQLAARAFQFTTPRLDQMVGFAFFRPRAAGRQALASVLYQATPRDPLVLAAVPFSMALIGAGPVDPLEALRRD